jgi:hypothetical protein
MHFSGDRRMAAVLSFIVVALVFLLVPPSALAFTQRSVSVLGAGDLVPMGHEWVTRLAAVELIGYEPGTAPDCRPGVKWCDPNDPRKEWTQGLARNLDLSSPGAQAEVRRIKGMGTAEDTYRARYKPVFDAIIGERWVDLTGYNVVTSVLLDSCWTAVAQEAEDAQYDHFMRKWNELGGDGGLTAARESRARFIRYFVNAAMAPPTTMFAYDGGAQASTATIVDRNYFLFGRAVHLLQDSFSSEHTVRIARDNHVQVRQVLSYMCSKGAEQHTHDNDKIRDFTSGDVIWLPGTRFSGGWASYRPSFMKAHALVATEASKDLWAAFIRTMGTPMAQRQAVAEAEAKTLADNWMAFDEKELRDWYAETAHRGPTYVDNDADVQSCMKTIDKGKWDDPAKRAAWLVDTRRTCLYNALPWTGYADLADPSTNMYYSWKWMNGPLAPMSKPRDGWQPTPVPADSGTRLRIRSVLNQKYLGVERIESEAWVYAKDLPPLDLIMVGPHENAMFRVPGNPRLFLSYRNSDGAVKLFDFGTGVLDPTNYKVARAPAGWSLLNPAWNRYMWLYDSTLSPYISWSGDPQKTHSQWLLEEQR